MQVGTGVTKQQEQRQTNNAAPVLTITLGGRDPEYSRQVVESRIDGCQ